MGTGRLFSICISPQRGQQKNEVLTAMVIAGHGIENDGHAGPWDRQVTCLNLASVIKINQDLGLQVGPGDFAENLLIEGLDMVSVGVGGQLKIGADVILEVAQIGKEDHPSVVTRALGVSLLPSEGLFCRVRQGGVIRKGDNVEVISCIE
ncbi:MAG TPA: MOSC domain-containing protein [Syntrophomonadaceae bacterium]|nr:MOSC domain-containing protein [Syntrophomonadaceae bacterium]